MLRPKITSLPGHIQSVFVQNILKLYGKILKAAEAKEEDELKAEVHALMQEKLPVFVQSGDLEVQERVRQTNILYFVVSYFFSVIVLTKQIKKNCVD